MRKQLEAVISQALQNHETTLGTVERNTEIKVVYLTLWALGWDPIQDIACNFHIPRNKFQGDRVKMAKAVDFAVRDSSGGISLLGEVKQCSVKAKKWEKGIEQIQIYQKAIKAPRVFLTSGFRWLILDEYGKKLADIQNAANGGRLIDQLTPYLMKGNVPFGATEPGDWNYGISPPSLRKQSKRDAQKD